MTEHLGPQTMGWQEGGQVGGRAGKCKLLAAGWLELVTSAGSPVPWDAQSRAASEAVSQSGKHFL